MTLCIAWKNGSQINFTSDSRLSSSQGVITDSASKIFKINLKIKSPTDKIKNTESISYQSNFGLCFTGSYLNGSLMAGAMDLLFSNIQAAPEFSDISIENLSDIAFNIYKKVSIQLMERTQREGLAQALFGGYCPLKKVFKLYKFEFTEDEVVEFSKNEINISDLPTFIGDTLAIEKANDLKDNISSDYDYYHLLKDIIKDTSISTVGGDIQSGIFENENFDIYGIVDYYIDESLDFPQVKSVFKFRGLEIDFDVDDLRSGYINPAISFMNPFEKERDLYFKDINQRIEDGNF